MPILRNQRHEMFAQAVVKGKTFVEAQEIAGYTRNHGNASTLAAKCADRINELKSRAEKGVNVTVAGLCGDLDRVLELAERVDSPGSAVAAIMAKAKLCGLITDKQQVSVETVTNDMELARWITARLDDAKPHDVGVPAEPLEPPPTPSKH